MYPISSENRGHTPLRLSLVEPVWLPHVLLPPRRESPHPFEDIRSSTLVLGGFLQKKTFALEIVALIAARVYLHTPNHDLLIRRPITADVDA